MLVLPFTRTDANASWDWGRADGANQLKASQVPRPHPVARALLQPGRPWPTPALVLEWRNDAGANMFASIWTARPSSRATCSKAPTRPSATRIRRKRRRAGAGTERGCLRPQRRLEGGRRAAAVLRVGRGREGLGGGQQKRQGEWKDVTWTVVWARPLNLAPPSHLLPHTPPPPHPPLFPPFPPPPLKLFSPPPPSSFPPAARGTRWSSPPRRSRDRTARGAAGSARWRARRPLAGRLAPPSDRRSARPARHRHARAATSGGPGSARLALDLPVSVRLRASGGSRGRRLLMLSSGLRTQWSLSFAPRSRIVRHVAVGAGTRRARGCPGSTARTPGAAP